MNNRTTRTRTAILLGVTASVLAGWGSGGTMAWAQNEPLGDGLEAQIGVIPNMPPGTQGDNTADAVLGQINFKANEANLIDGRGVNIASSGYGAVAIDRSVTPNRVFVADTGNNRVLGWKTVEASKTHVPPNIVIGQPDVYSHRCNINDATPTQRSLCGPTGVAVDSAGRLYVADSGNNRVLMYKAPFTTDRVADDVFGQFGNFEVGTSNSYGLSSDSLSNPVGLAVDAADNLWVGDQNNNRVLAFLSPEVKTANIRSGDTTADVVLGQLNSFVSSACNVVNLISANSLCTPQGVSVDTAGNVYVADRKNNRVLEYNKPLATDTMADRVFGQLGRFTTNSCNYPANGAVDKNGLCNPADLVIDTLNNLYISDTDNNRVLEYDTPTTKDAVPERIIGQKDYASSGCNNASNGTPTVSAASVCAPSDLAVDTAKNLYLIDTTNNRVLRYDAPLTTDAIADGALGQTVFTSANPDQIDGLGVNFSSAGGMGSIVVDASNHVYVVDPNNNRILAWNGFAGFTSHASATLVIGQPNMFVNSDPANGCNTGGLSESSLCGPRSAAVDKAGNLYVADAKNNRVLVYLTPFTTDTKADKVLGQAGLFNAKNCGLTGDGLCGPTGLALDALGNLYVSDSGNHRVLGFNKPLTTNTTADRVFGQQTLVDSGCNNGDIKASTLCNPQGVAVDTAGNLYVADTNNNRTLEYDKASSSDTTADRVYGQPAFVSSTCNNGALDANSLCGPRAVATDSLNNLYVSDAGNNRVLKYLKPLANAMADIAFGHGGQFTQKTCKAPSPNTLCTPDGIALAADNLFVADTTRNRVLRFDKP